MILTDRQTEFIKKAGFEVKEEYLPISKIDTVEIRKENTVIDIFDVVDIHFNRDQTMLSIYGHGTVLIHEDGTTAMKIYSKKL